VFTKSSKWQRLSILVAFAVLAVAAACSGGGNPTPLYPPTSGGIAGASAYTFPAVNGINSTMSVTGTGTLTASSSASAPSVGAIPQLKQRAQTGSSNEALIYYTVTASSTLTIKALSVQVGFTAAPTESVYLAYWDGTEWVAGSTPGAYAAGEVTLSLPSSALPITVQAGQSLYLAAYEGQQIGTPPPPVPVVSPNPLTLAEGTSQTVTVTSKAGLTITALSSNTNVVTVSPASETVGSDGTASFTVTAQYVASTANVTFTDPINQTATLVVTTNNSYSSPEPAPSAISLSANDTTDVAITTKPDSTITATLAAGSATGVISFPSSESASSTGSVSYPITAVAPGTATVTFTDVFGNTGSLTVNVSSITNGAFNNGLTGWTGCSYPHTLLASYTSPSPGPPAYAPSPWPAQSTISSGDQTGLETVVSSATAANFVSVTAPPMNDRMNYTAEPTAAPGATAAPTDPPGVGTTPPPVLGSDVAFIGSDEATEAGELGICQTFTVSAASPYLSFWVWEGGFNYGPPDYGDQDAVLLSNSTGTGTIVQALFQEENCFQDSSPAGVEAGLGPPSAYDNGCDPSDDKYNNNYWVNGGYWVQRGPYDLSGLAGQTVVFYVGQDLYKTYAASASAYHSEMMFLGNVQTSSSSAFPSTTPYTAHRVLTMTLKPR